MLIFVCLLLTNNSICEREHFWVEECLTISLTRRISRRIYVWRNRRLHGQSGHTLPAERHVPFDRPAARRRQRSRIRRTARCLQLQVVYSIVLNSSMFPVLELWAFLLNVLWQRWPLLPLCVPDAAAGCCSRLVQYERRVGATVRCARHTAGRGGREATRRLVRCVTALYFNSQSTKPQICALFSALHCCRCAQWTPLLRRLARRHYAHCEAARAARRAVLQPHHCTRRLLVLLSRRVLVQSHRSASLEHSHHSSSHRKIMLQLSGLSRVWRQ